MSRAPDVEKAFRIGATLLSLCDEIVEVLKAEPELSERQISKALFKKNGNLERPESAVPAVKYALVLLEGDGRVTWSCPYGAGYLARYTVVKEKTKGA